MADEVEGPGSRLRAARTGLEASTREVADALNLPVHVIEALEADDFEQLPPTVFTRGYLRSYARLLEISPDEVVEHYPAPQTDTEIMEVVETSSTAVEPRLIRYGVIGLAGIALLTVLAIWLFSGSAEDQDLLTPEADMELELESDEDREADVIEDSRQPADSRQEAEPETSGENNTGGERNAATIETTVPPPARQDALSRQEAREAREAASAEDAPPLENSSPTSDPAAETVDTLTQQPAPAVESDPAPAIDPVVAERQPIPQLTPGVRQITESGDDMLELSFIDECWVEVKTEDGENLYSDLNRSGTTLRLRGEAPFRILLGYAPGVVLDFNGERVALSDYTRNNVANLVLGR